MLKHSLLILTTHYIWPTNCMYYAFADKSPVGGGLQKRGILCRHVLLYVHKLSLQWLISAFIHDRGTQSWLLFPNKNTHSVWDGFFPSLRNTPGSCMQNSGSTETLLHNST